MNGKRAQRSRKNPIRPKMNAKRTCSFRLSTFGNRFGFELVAAFEFEQLERPGSAGSSDRLRQQLYRHLVK
jgi:hypothetical protein